MKTKLLAVLFIAVPFFFIGCDEDSITDATLGPNSITLSGDINKSFSAVSFAEMIYMDTTSMFTVMILPEDSGPNSIDDIPELDDVLVLANKSDVLPAVGNYNVGNDAASFLNGDFGDYDSEFYL